MHKKQFLANEMAKLNNDNQDGLFFHGNVDCSNIWFHVNDDHRKTENLNVFRPCLTGFSHHILIQPNYKPYTVLANDLKFPQRYNMTCVLLLFVMAHNSASPHPLLLYQRM